MATPTISRPDTVGYEVLRESHKRAYAYLSEALRIDEDGKGDVSMALDYYSKGVAELEKGVSYRIHAKGEELAKAVSVKSKMEKNLEMARDRVADLLNGGSLRGSSISPPKKRLPTESLAAMTKPIPKKASGGPMKGPSAGVNRGLEESHGKGKKSPSAGKKKGGGVERGVAPKVSNIQGVDSKLAQTILDQVVEHETSITWEDIVGLELPKRTLQEIVILPTLRPELFTGLRSPARGLLLFGPPGNGKTMLAKAVAHESQARFFNISASTLTSKWVGEGEKLVKALFAMARELQPSVIFLDEVDALLSRRGENEHDAMRRMKNEFLQCFDGMGTSEGDRVLVMAATNRPQELDDAALRRFEKRIYIPLPSLEARKSVLQKLLAKHHNIISSSQLDQIAKHCEGYSASDLTALAKDSALGPIRDVDYETLRQMPANKVRPMCVQDFEKSMRLVRPSVNPSLIGVLEQWNADHGITA